jgi:hypothetical protein
MKVLEIKDGKVISHGAGPYGSGIFPVQCILIHARFRTSRIFVLLVILETFYIDYTFLDYLSYYFFNQISVNLAFKNLYTT